MANNVSPARETLLKAIDAKWHERVFTDAEVEGFFLMCYVAIGPLYDSHDYRKCHEYFYFRNSLFAVEYGLDPEELRTEGGFGCRSGHPLEVSTYVKWCKAKDGRDAEKK